MIVKLFSCVMIKKCVVHLEAKSMRFLVRGSAFSSTTHFFIFGGMIDMNENIREANTGCFIGHRKINETKEMKENLKKIIEKLIIVKGVNTFLFGSRSQFDDICLETVSELKEKYPHIKRIYVRAEYHYINEQYEKFLSKFYEGTYFPEHIIKAGKGVYVERNYEMIKNSRFCVVYYDEKTDIANRKSGTKIAFEYAHKNNKEIINIANL